MTNLHLLPAVPYRLPLAELLRQADLLPSHVLVYLPTRDEVVAFTPDTAVLLLDSGAYDEHLAPNAAGQPVELSFPGLSAAFTVDLVQQVLEAARAEGPDTPEFYIASLNHYYDHDAFLPGDATRNLPEGTRVNPLDYAFVWQGEGTGWVILRSSWGGPILMHRPTASPLVLPPGVVNYWELVAVARAHGVPEVDVL